MSSSLSASCCAIAWYRIEYLDLLAFRCPSAVGLTYSPPSFIPAWARVVMVVPCLRHLLYAGARLLSLLLDLSCIALLGFDFVECVLFMLLCPIAGIADVPPVDALPSSVPSEEVVTAILVKGPWCAGLR